MAEHSRGRDRDAVKAMADLLRAGATMLSEKCPICGLPLFRLRSGEIVCPVHGRIYVVRSESEYTRVTVEAALEALERLAATRISELTGRLEQSRSTSELGELVQWLEVLERVERVKTYTMPQQSGEERQERRRGGGGRG